ncbi:hypothetical protein H671_1g0146 [Cricetulus griseus]|nr:hypothetical protein H671_1g0146 [Cricetulus griseus]
MLSYRSLRSQCLWGGAWRPTFENVGILTKWIIPVTAPFPVQQQPAPKQTEADSLNQPGDPVLMFLTLKG